MLSRRCRYKNEVTIPEIFRQWAKLPSGEKVIDMSSAENMLMRTELLDKMKSTYSFTSLREKASPGFDFSYAEGIGGPLPAREALAHLFNTHFKPHTLILPSHILLAAGGCSALDALIQQICDPGDGILIATPYWPGFDISLSVQNEAVIIPVHIPLDLATKAECVTYYRNALRDAEKQRPVKALLLCNPTNPTGECYSSNTLSTIVEFCALEKIHLISDEVYALSVHGGERETSFNSVLGLESSYENTHVIYSLSKDFGCSSIRIGALIEQNNNIILLASALTVGPQVSILTAHLAATILLSPDSLLSFLSNNSSRLHSAYVYTTTVLLKHDVEFIPAVAGPFLFAKLGQKGEEEEEERIVKALKKESVKLASGKQYHFDEWGWFRIVFALKREELVEGLRRIVSVTDREKYVGKKRKRESDRSEIEEREKDNDGKRRILMSKESI